MRLSPRADRPSALDLDLLRRWPLPEDDAGDKFARGTVLVVAGSSSTPGAAILAGRAALRMGAGRIQIATDPDVASYVAVAVPESKTISYHAGGEVSDELLRDLSAADCVLVGPGLAKDGLEELVRAVFQATSHDGVIVADAAAIEVVSGLPQEVLATRDQWTVLTPNRQELDGLACADVAMDHHERVLRSARALRAVVTSFGSVAAPDGRAWQMDAGHPGLGTSGSGDVLCGLVAGVAARTHDAAQAACWGTLAHALAGEHLGRQHGSLGFLAGELIDAVAPALVMREGKATRGRI